MSNPVHPNQRSNIVAGLLTGGLDASVLGVIMFAKEYFMPWVMGMGHLILFPTGVGTQAILALLAWRQVYLDGGKRKRNWIHALVETGLFAAVTVAIAGSLFAAAAFGLAAPIIITAAVGLKSCYHAAAAAYWLGRAVFMEPREDELDSASDRNNKFYQRRTKYLTMAKDNAVGATIGFAITGVMIAVNVLFHVKIAAVVGLPVAAAAVTLCGYKLLSTLCTAEKPTAKRQPSPPPHSAAPSHRAASSPGIISRLRTAISPSNDDEFLPVAQPGQRAPQSSSGGLLSTMSSLFSCSTHSSNEDLDNDLNEDLAPSMDRRPTSGWFHRK